jgi:enoyl-CoA hydratase
VEVIKEKSDAPNDSSADCLVSQGAGRKVRMSVVVTAAEAGVLKITLNRPEVRNAINVQLVDGLQAALRILDADSELRVGVLTGAGGNFCSGMDLKSFAAGEWPFTDGKGPLIDLLARPARKPLIAAVEGYAVAGGLELALACDLVVAGSECQVGIPEVKRAIVAAGGALFRLPRRIPYHVAMEMALTGDLIGADRAYELGLINRVVESGTALANALVLGDTIARNGPLAVVASKEILIAAQNWTEGEAWERQRELAAPALTSSDAREGAKAFTQQREPMWRSR